MTWVVLATWWTLQHLHRPRCKRAFIPPISPAPLTLAPLLAPSVHFTRDGQDTYTKGHATKSCCSERYRSRLEAELYFWGLALLLAIHMPRAHWSAFCVDSSEQRDFRYSTFDLHNICYQTLLAARKWLIHEWRFAGLDIEPSIVQRAQATEPIS